MGWGDGDGGWCEGVAFFDTEFDGGGGYGLLFHNCYDGSVFFIFYRDGFVYRQHFLNFVGYTFYIVFCHDGVQFLITYSLGIYLCYFFCVLFVILICSTILRWYP